MTGRAVVETWPLGIRSAEVLQLSLSFYGDRLDKPLYSQSRDRRLVDPELQRIRRHDPYHQRSLPIPPSA